MNKLYTLLLIVILTGCSDNATQPEEIPINVNVRMEVQILDSEFHVYSRPFTKIYFTTYKELANDSRSDFEQSDTISCPNGWGVKILDFTLNNAEEKIILGAANEGYDGANFRFEEITYNQAEVRIDSTGTARMIKTFAIYYN